MLLLQAELEVALSDEANKVGKKTSLDSEKRHELLPSDVVITMPFPEAYTVGNDVRVAAVVVISLAAGRGK